MLQPQADRPAGNAEPYEVPAGASSLRLAPPAAFRYRAATRVDTLGGNAAEGRLTRRLSTFTVQARCQPRTLQNKPKGNAMSHDTYELKAEAREQVGKGSARAVRRNGKVPAVIYGDKQPPLAIALTYKDIYYKIHGGGFLTTIATIDVDGKKIQVLPKDFQLDPVKDFPVHVDFLRIGKDTEVNVDVPVHFINEDKSPGIKRGGVLNVVRHEVEFNCPADAIPDFITVDLEGAEIGVSLHISSVKLPPNMKPVISDRDFTIATVTGSSAQKSEADEAADAAVAAAAAAESAEAKEEK
jgi:large subunit ribosomal protein L25